MLRVLTKFSKMKLSIPAISYSRSVVGVYLLFLIALICCSVYPVIYALFKQWITVADYDYCILIALISLGWLGWLFGKVNYANSNPDYRFTAAVMLLCFLEYVLWQGMSELGSQVIIPIIILCLIYSIIGIQQGMAFLPPIVFFYFAIPIWDQFLPFLQQIAIFGAVVGMKGLGVTVSLSGNNVKIPEGTFEVLYGCSGLRYVIVSLALAFLIGSVNALTRMRFVLLVILSGLLAIVFNWLRICIVMYAGHLTSMQHYFVIESHKGLGHVLFIILLMMIYLLGEKLKSTQILINEEEIKYDVQVLGVPSKIKLPVVVCSLSIITLGYLNLRSDFTAQEDRALPALSAAPFSSQRWQGPLPSKSTWRPSFIGAADSRQVSYTDGEAAVYVYQNVYGRQSKGEELVFYKNTIYAPGKWQLVSYDFVSIVKSLFGVYPYSTVQLSPDGHKWLVGALYTVGTLKTSVGLFAQMLYGWSTITGGVPSGLLAISIKCASDCDLERNLLADFWSNMGQALIASAPTLLEPDSIHLKEFK